RRVVNQEVFRAIDLQRHARDMRLLHAGADVRAAAAQTDLVRGDPRQQAGDRSYRLAPRVVAGEAEPERPEHAAIRLEHHHVLAELGAVLVAVGEAATA